MRERVRGPLAVIADMDDEDTAVEDDDNQVLLALAEGEYA